MGGRRRRRDPMFDFANPGCRHRVIGPAVRPAFGLSSIGRDFMIFMISSQSLFPQPTFLSSLLYCRALPISISISILVSVDDAQPDVDFFNFSKRFLWGDSMVALSLLAREEQTALSLVACFLF